MPGIFADGTNITVSDRALTELKRALNPELSNLSCGLKANKVSLNVAKTELMIIGSRQRLSVQNEDVVIKIEDQIFSNSLIIHGEKTKEITTVKEVWICDPNYHKIRRTFALIFSKNYQCFEKLYQALERVFHQISKHFEVGLKKLGRASFFQPTSQCLDI